MRGVLQSYFIPLFAWPVTIKVARRGAERDRIAAKGRVRGRSRMQVSIERLSAGFVFITLSYSSFSGRGVSRCAEKGASTFEGPARTGSMEGRADRPGRCRLLPEAMFLIANVASSDDGARSDESVPALRALCGGHSSVRLAHYTGHFSSVHAISQNIHSYRELITKACSIRCRSSRPAVRAQRSTFSRIQRCTSANSGDA